ncbi:hypothetical protein [Sedimentitalea sp.]|uniref:hypothetical protein n=1 Tax=Sedimentitalea sp. TaxID=2048915 RepID=UPI003298E53B
MKLAPVCVFAYRRPEHTKRTLAALASSPLAQQTNLTVFVDGPRDAGDADEVAQVVSLAQRQGGFAGVDVRARDENAGLARSIQEGVSQMMSDHGRAIVVEDDIVTSPSFLNYMNLALDRYADSPEVWHISGYNEPIAGNRDRPGTALWRFMSCWGWASWADRWSHFERDPDELLASFSPEDIERFNLDGAHDFWSQVLANARGDMRTWAVFWYATIFRNGGLCLAPYHSYAENIGFDGSGTHCGPDGAYLQASLNRDMAPSFPDQLIEDSAALAELKAHYSYRPTKLEKLGRKWRKLIKRVGES